MEQSTTAQSTYELTVETIAGGIDVISKLSDEWREMLSAVENDPPYWRPEWILAALRAYSPDAKLIVFMVRRRGRLCAVLPLVEERAKFAGLPCKKLRAPLTTAGVGIDLLCALPASEQDAAVALIWSAIKKKTGWDVLELPSVFQDAVIERLSSLAQKEGHPTGSWSVPLIAIFLIPQGPEGKKELEKYPRHPKLRSKVRQREKKLAALGAVRLVRTEKDGANDLRRFYEMEASGWKGREGSAIISDPRSRQFFDEVTREAERFGHLCLYTLEVNGKAIAAHIGLNYRGRYWAAKSAYDENYRDYAPGHLIVKAILQDCSERGVSEYMMGVREDWKLEWTEDVRKRNYECIFGRGLWPRALYAARFSLRRRLAGLKNLHAGLSATLSQLTRRIEKSPLSENTAGQNSMNASPAKTDLPQQDPSKTDLTKQDPRKDDPRKKEEPTKPVGPSK